MKAAGDTRWKAVGGRGAPVWVHILYADFWDLAGFTSIFSEQSAKVHKHMNQTVQTVWLEGVPEHHITKISVQLQLER